MPEESMSTLKLPDKWLEFHAAVAQENLAEIFRLQTAWGSPLTRLVAGWPDEENNTALHLAAQTNDILTFKSVIKVLGRDDALVLIGLQNHEGNHVLHLVMANQALALYLLEELSHYPRVLSLLLVMVNHRGETPFYLACSNYQVKVIQRLLAWMPFEIGELVLTTGLSIDVVGNDGALTPLIALERWHKKDNNRENKEKIETIIIALLCHYGKLGAELDVDFPQKMWGKKVINLIMNNLFTDPGKRISDGLKRFLISYKDELKRRISECEDVAILQCAKDDETTLGGIVATARDFPVSQTATQLLVENRLVELQLLGSSQGITRSRENQSLSIVLPVLTTDPSFPLAQSYSELCYSIESTTRSNGFPEFFLSHKNFLKRSELLQVNENGVFFFWFLMRVIVKRNKVEDIKFFDEILTLFTTKELLFLVCYKAAMSQTVLDFIILCGRVDLFLKIMNKIEKRDQQIALRLTGAFLSSLAIRNTDFFDYFLIILGKESLNILLKSGKNGMTALHYAMREKNEYCVREIVQELRRQGYHKQIASASVSHYPNIMHYVMALRSSVVFLMLISELSLDDTFKLSELVKVSDLDGHTPIMSLMYDQAIHGFDKENFSKIIECFLIFFSVDFLVAPDEPLEKRNYKVLKKPLGRWVRSRIKAWVNTGEELKLSNNEKRIFLKYQKTIVDTLRDFAVDSSCFYAALDQKTTVGAILAENVEDSWDRGRFAGAYNAVAMLKGEIDARREPVAEAIDKRDLGTLKNIFRGLQEQDKKIFANLTDSNGVPLFCIAMQLGDLTFFDAIMTALSEEDLKALLDWKNQYSVNIMHYAFCSKNPNISEKILSVFSEKGWLTDCRKLFFVSQQGCQCTPLHYAAKHGKEAIARIRNCVGDGFSELALVQNASRETAFDVCLRRIDLEAISFILGQLAENSKNQIVSRRYIYGLNKNVTLLHVLAIRQNVALLKKVCAFMGEEKVKALSVQRDSFRKFPIEYTRDYRLCSHEKDDPVDFMGSFLEMVGFDQLMMEGLEGWFIDNSEGLKKIACKITRAIVKKMIADEQCNINEPEKKLLMAHKSTVVEYFMVLSQELASPEKTEKEILWMGLDRENVLGKIFAENRSTGIFSSEKTKSVLAIESRLLKIAGAECQGMSGDRKMQSLRG